MLVINAKKMTLNPYIDMFFIQLLNCSEGLFGNRMLQEDTLHQNKKNKKKTNKQLKVSFFINHSKAILITIHEFACTSSPDGKW